MAGKLDCKKTQNSFAILWEIKAKQHQKIAKFIIKNSPDFYHTICSIPPY
jgi:hypothetical protein